jgi:hypothetical protein
MAGNLKIGGKMSQMILPSSKSVVGSLFIVATACLHVVASPEAQIHGQGAAILKNGGTIQ